MLHHRVSCLNIIKTVLRWCSSPGSLLLQINKMDWYLDMILSALPAVTVVNLWIVWAMVPSMLQWGCSFQPLSTAARSLHPPVQGQDLGSQWQWLPVSYVIEWTFVFRCCCISWLLKFLQPEDIVFRSLTYSPQIVDKLVWTWVGPTPLRSAGHTQYLLQTH